MQTGLRLFFIWTILAFGQFPTTAQTAIGQQDFELAPTAPILNYTVVGGSFSTGNAPFPNAPKFVSGSRGYQINKTTTVLTFDPVNTSAFTAVNLHFRLASFAGTSGNGNDAADFVEVEISTDGGATWSSELYLQGNSNAKWSFSSGTGIANTPYDGNNTPTLFQPSGGGNRTTDGYSTLAISNLPSTNSLSVRISMRNSSTNEYWVIDDLLIEGTPIAICPHSIASFAPTSGAVGTQIWINGSGFTPATTVDFNGLAVVPRFVDATTIIATVPAGVTDGLIHVIEAGCTETTSSPFSLLSQIGSCGILLSDLIITEIYDATAGSLGYIEIYNGTGNPIDLTDYRIDRYASLGGTTSTYSYTFPTSGTGSTIVDGEILVGRISAGSGLEDFSFGGTTAGFNSSDRLELIYIPTGSIIDDWHEFTVPGGTGYSYLRNTNVTAPNPNYNFGEWTGSGTESTADLGTFAISTLPAPAINVQPHSITACAVNFDVTVSGNGGTLVYQWYFNQNDGIATNWTAVSAAHFTGATLSGETTNSLNIVGDLAPFDQYQFYCEIIENGSCGSTSDVAIFSINPDKYFRSVATGNWGDIQTWEMAASSLGPWYSACAYPVDDNSDYIHILPNHTVHIDRSITADNIVVELGGTLYINNGERLIINNGTGLDVNVLGTLVDDASGIDGFDLNTHHGTWSLGNNGQIIKTGSSGLSDYRDNYEGGIATIPATANWRFRYNGVNGNVSVITVGMFYPNLYIESTSGDYAFSTGSRVFNGLNDFMTVKGNFYIGNTGNGAVQVYNKNTNTTALQVLGDMVIGGNGSTNNSVFVNDQAGITGTGLEIHGDLTIHNNGLLDFDNGNPSPDGHILLHGDWTDLQTGNGFDEGESTVQWIGNTNQILTKTTGSESFYKVIVNKSAGDLLNNANDFTIKNNMTFVNGIVRTSNTAYLLFEAAASSTGASNNSHVDGPVIKETNNGSITNFTYPTGDNGIYAAIGIETRFHLGEYYIAEYFNTIYPNRIVNPTELHHVSQMEYWLLNELVGGSGENLKVTLHWAAHSQVVTLPSLRVAHYYTQAPSLSNIWESEGNTATTGTATMGSITSDYISSFSPFTLGDFTNQISLPLDLLDFTATKVTKTAVLDWQVANEQKGDRYCLQRSSDALHFETLQCFDADQNNSIADYQYIDAQPLTGANYYRIAQVDFLGDLNYSPIRVLHFEQGSSLLVYPNPAKDYINLEFPQNTKEDYQISLIDELGRRLINETITSDSRLYRLAVSKLSAGLYILRLSGQNGYAHSQKIIIQP